MTSRPTSFLSQDVHETDYEVAGRVQLVARPWLVSLLPIFLVASRLLDGLSQSTIRGRSRMKVSVGEPHSDQRDRPVGRLDGFVRGHRLWIAVKLARLDDLGLYAATSRAARDGSYDASCFQSAYSTCASFRANAMIATWAPRRSAICFAHRTIGSVFRRM